MQARNEVRFCLRMMSLSLAVLLAAAPVIAEAQDNAGEPAAPAKEAPPALAPESKASFTRAELETLLAPIALYPDSLLAQMLPASAYPLQIVQAHRWLDTNPEAVARAVSERTESLGDSRIS